MNAPPPLPDDQTCRLIAALGQLSSDAGKAAQELRRPDEPWVSGAVAGIHNDAQHVSKLCIEWLAARRDPKPVPKPIPTVEEQRETRRLNALTRKIKRGAA